MSLADSASDDPGSLRLHPRLSQLFADSESRYFTAEERRQYCEIVPHYRHRAQASAEMEQVEKVVVSRTITEIMGIYPYHERHQLAPEKCERDVRYACAYATQAMLMNDPQWFADKLLIWMKSIIQVFEFPPRGKPLTNAQRRERDKTDGAADLLAVIDRADQLPDYRASIYATYARLKQNYQASLTPPTWMLMEQPLQQTVDTLAAE